MVAGLLLGGFYAAVSLGISLIFGLLDIANIAQPAFLILGSYAAYVMNSAFGLDPILAGVLLHPGVLRARASSSTASTTGASSGAGEESLRGLVFFFGLLFIIEVEPQPEVRRRLPAGAGGVHRPVDRARRASAIAFRLLVPCLVGARHDAGALPLPRPDVLRRAIMAVSQDAWRCA